MRRWKCSTCKRWVDEPIEQRCQMCTMRKSYDACVVGGTPPELALAPGSVLLTLRPDLIGTLDPAGAYLVTAQGIIPVDESDE